MDSRIVVEIDDKLKKEAQMEAIKNDTTLKEIVAAALNNYLHPQKSKPGPKNKNIKIN